MPEIGLEVTQLVIRLTPNNPLHRTPRKRRLRATFMGR